MEFCFRVDIYHAEIFEGEKSTSLGNKDWAFGNCHHEKWDCPTWPNVLSCNHWVYENGFNDGRKEFYDDLYVAGVIHKNRGRFKNVTIRMWNKYRHMR